MAGARRSLVGLMVVSTIREEGWFLVQAELGELVGLAKFLRSLTRANAGGIYIGAVGIFTCGAERIVGTLLLGDTERGVLSDICVCPSVASVRVCLSGGDGGYRWAILLSSPKEDIILGHRVYAERRVVFFCFCILSVVKRVVW